MYMVESRGGAIVCMLVSLFFLGTWPAVMTLLERRGRLPQHTYLDYTITNLLAAVIIAFTFGQIGTDHPNFLSQLSQVGFNIIFSMFILNGKREHIMHLMIFLGHGRTSIYTNIKNRCVLMLKIL